MPCSETRLSAGTHTRGTKRDEIAEQCTRKVPFAQSGILVYAFTA